MNPSVTVLIIMCGSRGSKSHGRVSMIKVSVYHVISLHTYTCTYIGEIVGWMVVVICLIKYTIAMNPRECSNLFGGKLHERAEQ